MQKLVANLKSWKTTAVGVLSGIGLLVAQLTNLLDADPDTVLSVEIVVTALALIGGGIFAKDGDKKSTDVGL